MLQLQIVLLLGSLLDENCLDLIKVPLLLWRGATARSSAFDRVSLELLAEVNGLIVDCRVLVLAHGVVVVVVPVEDVDLLATVGCLGLGLA